MPFSRNERLVLGGLILVAVGMKAGLLAAGVVQFNSDEAIVALMARHILQGEIPVFFYGQSYMGSLDAILVAGGFWIFGQHVWVIRFIQVILYAGTLVTTAWIGALGFGSSRAGLFATALLAIPTVNLTLYTTVSLGGYGEALLLGNLMLFFCLRLRMLFLNPGSAPRQRKVVIIFILLGLLAGLGVWSNALSLVYAIPVAIAVLALLINHRQSLGKKVFITCILVGLLGANIGASPLWFHVVKNGLSGIWHDMVGLAVAVDQSSWLGQVGAHLVNLVALGGTVTFGFRPPWEVNWLGLPLLPFALFFWMVVIYMWLRNGLRREPQAWMYRLLAGVALTFALGFLATPFGIDPSGRYFIPLAIILALAAGGWLVNLTGRLWVQLVLVCTVLVFNLWGIIQCSLRYPPGLTTQFYTVTAIDHDYDAELLSFLRAEGETRGYTNYWVAYPLAFKSHEEVIFVPHLPYHLDLRHTSRDDRYPPYDELVEASPRIAYITTRNPALDATLRNGFTVMGVKWDEKQIGDYRVYYHLTRPVQPAELNLQVSVP